MTIQKQHVSTSNGSQISTSNVSQISTSIEPNVSTSNQPSATIEPQAPEPSARQKPPVHACVVSDGREEWPHCLAGAYHDAVVALLPQLRHDVARGSGI